MPRLAFQIRLGFMSNTTNNTTNTRRIATQETPVSNLAHIPAIVLPETRIERTTWEDGNKPAWRLITQVKLPNTDGTQPDHYRVGEHLVSARLSAAVARTPWAIIPFKTEIDKAIAALGGPTAVEGTRRSPGNRFTFAIYSNRFTAYDRTTGETKTWSWGSTEGWVAP